MPCPGEAALFPFLGTTGSAPLRRAGNFRVLDAPQGVEMAKEALLTIEGQINEILRIAETRCPVKDNLNNPTPMTLRCAPVPAPVLA